MKALAIFLIGVAIFIICFLARSNAKSNDNKKKVNTHLYTHIHDGHKFIFHNSYGRAGGLIHHPDCECSTNKVGK